MSISSEQISVVVQGAIDRKTKSVLASIRSSFPYSQIILSTWEKSDVGDLDFDEVVFSKDVGESSFPNMMDKNNVNRQIVSTKAGVELAKREYILKTRTDILFENSNFLNIYETYMNSGVSWQKGRIAICNYYSRNPRMFPLSYHPSDWLTFGYAEDIKKYYDIQLLTDDYKQQGDFNLCPESYIFTEYLRRNGIVLAEEAVSYTEELFAKCFVVVDKECFSIIFTKYNPNRFHDQFSLISHKKWKILYNYYSNGRIWYKIMFGLYKTYSNTVGVLISIYRSCRR